MKHGPGWIIYEENYKKPGRNFISVLSSRKSWRSVKDYIKQLYVDRYGSITEKIEYKKSSKKFSYTFVPDNFTRTIHCGDDPYLVAISAQSIKIVGNKLEFTYKIAADLSDPMNPVFEERSQSLEIKSSPDSNET